MKSKRNNEMKSTHIVVSGIITQMVSTGQINRAARLISGHYRLPTHIAQVVARLIRKGHGIETAIDHTIIGNFGNCFVPSINEVS